MRYRKIMAPGVIAITAGLLLTPSAGATPPIPSADFSVHTYPAGTVCPFTVSVQSVANKSLLHILRNGQLMITGRLVDRITNEATGSSRLYTVNGPLRIIPREDGSTTLVSHGRILWTLLDEDAGGPGIFVFTGRVVMQVSPDNALVSTSRIPGLEDVCSELG